MTILEFIQRKEAVCSMSGLSPYAVTLPASVIAELQADIAAKGGLIAGFSGEWCGGGYSGERTDEPVMRLANVFVFVGEGPVWS